jgi:hypothetical protein
MKLLSVSAVALVALTTLAQAQTQTFTGPDDRYLGSANHYGNTTTYTGPQGEYLGSANRYGGTTTLTGPQGQYQGSINTYPDLGGLPASRRR